MAKRGFTLVELLVVISIIGILMGLLLPAVNSARESARRLQCSNNIKQLALAALSYEQGHEIFPPAALSDAPTAHGSYKVSKLKPNWVILSLPFMDQQALHDEFMALLGQGSKDNPVYIESNVSLSTNSSVTMGKCRSTKLSIFRCPSDVNANNPFTDGKASGKPEEINWARGNYGANVGLHFISNLANKTSAWWDNPAYRGIMGGNVSISVSEIKDGASNTILLGELRSGVNNQDARGVWAMGGAGASALAHHGWAGDANGPNCLHPYADNIYLCRGLGYTHDELVILKMPCPMHCTGDEQNSNTEATTRSLHAGGVHIALADGSVHWITDNIQTGASGSNLGVWDLLNLSMDGLPLSSSVY